MDCKFVLHSSVYVYTQDCPAGITPFAQFSEKEGTTYILRQKEAQGLPVTFSCCCIQIEQETALTAVGITAKVAGVLAAAKIPCNVIAAYHHDYFFVPETHGKKALSLLQDKGSKP